MLKTFMIIAVVSGSLAFAKTKETMDQRYPTVMTGKLLDLQAPLATNDHPGATYTVQIGDLIYTAWCEGIIGNSVMDMFQPGSSNRPCPNNFIVGDPVEIRISRFDRPLTHDAADKDKTFEIVVSKDEKVKPDSRVETLHIIRLERVKATQ